MALTCCLALALQPGCGQVEPLPDGGLASGGASDGTLASGGTGAAASGGLTGATGGGGLIIDPIVDPEVTPAAPCDQEYPGLDPPCNAEDLHGELTVCVSSRRVDFAFPLTDVTPPAAHLRLVALPLDSTLGAGGLGGSTGLLEASVPLAASYITPESAGELASETFSLSAEAESVDSVWHFSDEDPTEGDYLESHGAEDDWYSLAEVALVDGDSILEQRRLLVDRGFTCLK